MENLPFFDATGERARLFPVLSEKSKEGRTLSAFLAVLGQVREFANEALGALGKAPGVRSTVHTFTEVSFPNSTKPKLRPDGLIVVTLGNKSWSALIEAKVGTSQLEAEQVENYLALAKEVGADCVITISNDFVSTHDASPVNVNRTLLRKVDLYHFSWFSILTFLNVLGDGKRIADDDHRFLLHEFERFLVHESAGLKRFTQMPSEWTATVEKVRSGLPVLKTADESRAVIDAWQSEIRDLCLYLTRKTGAVVSPKYPPKTRNDAVAQFDHHLQSLVTSQRLSVALTVPNAAAPIQIDADLATRTIHFSAELTAPKDKKRQASRLNWLLFQLPEDAGRETKVRSLWPGRAEPIETTLSEAKADPALHSHPDKAMLPHKFVLIDQVADGRKFSGRSTFITELEEGALEFYETVLSSVKAWVPPAPKVRPAAEESPAERHGSE